MPVLPDFESQVLERPHGVRLTIYERPGPHEGAPVAMLVSGLGGTLSTWSHIVDALGATHRIVHWDYRGLYASRLAVGLAAAAIPWGIDAHRDDALAVMDTLNIASARLFGWSMGVQLSLELALTAPERVDAIVSLCGGFGRTLHTTFLGPLGERSILPGMGLFRAALKLAADPIQALVRHPVALRAAKTFGLIGEGIDDAFFMRFVAGFLKLDFDVYNRILAALDDHDLESRLGEISVPTLVIAGERDVMTPAWISQRMADCIPNASLFVLPKATHFAPIEQPEGINARVAAFLNAHLDPA